MFPETNVCEDGVFIQTPWPSFNVNFGGGIRMGSLLKINGDYSSANTALLKRFQEIAKQACCIPSTARHIFIDVRHNDRLDDIFRKVVFMYNCGQNIGSVAINNIQRIYPTPESHMVRNFAFYLRARRITGFISERQFGAWTDQPSMAAKDYSQQSDIEVGIEPLLNTRADELIVRLHPLKGRTEVIVNKVDRDIVIRV